MKTNKLQDFHICTSVPIKFSLLLPFYKTIIIIRTYSLFVLDPHHGRSALGDQIGYIFLIEFSNKLCNFAEPFKSKCNLKNTRVLWRKVFIDFTWLLWLVTYKMKSSFKNYFLFDYQLLRTSFPALLFT